MLCLYTWWDPIFSWMSQTIQSDFMTNFFPSQNLEYFNCVSLYSSSWWLTGLVRLHSISDTGVSLLLLASMGSDFFSGEQTLSHVQGWSYVTINSKAWTIVQMRWCLLKTEEKQMKKSIKIKICSKRQYLIHHRLNG